MDREKTTYKKRFKPPCIEIAKTATYKIGKTTAVVDGVFRQGNAETVTGALARLMMADAEKLKE
jgi:hypothetical protein